MGKKRMIVGLIDGLNQAIKFLNGYNQDIRINTHETFVDFFDAWTYLEEHAIYQDKYHLSRFQGNCLYINVVKVNPNNGIIDDNSSLNTKIQVWLESGKYEDVNQTGTHDIDLDCGADTFEEAIIELANLVCKKFKQHNSTDAFYSESNMKALRQSIREADEGKFTTKTMSELRATDDEHNDI